MKKCKKENADRLSELNEMMMATKNAFEQQAAQTSAEMSSTLNQTEKLYAEEFKKQAEEKEKIMKEMGSEKSQFEIQMTSLTDKLQYLNQTIAAKTEQIVKLEQEKNQLNDSLNQ